MPVLINCTNCGNECVKYPCDIRRTDKLFCSNDCKHEWSKLKNHPKWKGGRRIDPQGYVLLRVHDRDKPIYEHRYLMEKKLGRRLRSDEYTHHKNENKTDNRIENLLLCTNSEHVKIHGVTKLKGWSLWYGEECFDCGENKKRHYAKGLCYLCYMKGYQKRKRDENRITMASIS